MLVVMSVVGVGVLFSCKKKTKTEEILTTQFTLKITKTGTGTVSASYAGVSATEAQLTAGVKIDKDVAVTLTATPSTEMPNVVWNGTQTGNTLPVTMDKDQTISVAFSANPLVYHSISFTTTPADEGTLKVYDMTGNLITDITKIVENAKVRISIIPVVGYKLSDLSGVDIAGTDTTLTMTADKTMTASFTAIPTYKILFTATPADAGMLKVYDMAGNLITDITKIVENAKVRISIIPAVGKALTAITGVDIAGTDTTLTMTADKTITATFEVAKYTVSFNSNGGSAVTAITNVLYDATITKPAPDPTKTGYTFAGWYKESGLTNAWTFATDKVTANTTLYAKWTIKTYTVTFNSNGGSAVTAITTDSNTTIIKPADPTKTGYAFGGWYKESGLTNAWDFATNKITATTTLYAKWMVFPDANFRAKLVALGLVQTNGDIDPTNTTNQSKFNSITTLDVSSSTIASLQGIAFFTKLTDLRCYTNQLTTLDVSKNTALTDLRCFNNQLTALDVSKNTALTNLSCSNNQLTALDVSKNTALKELRCNFNQLTTLDVSKNTVLTLLFCYSNQLTALDVSKNTALKELNCNTNQLTVLDVSKNTALTILNCNTNQLTALNVSTNTALKELYCNTKQLTALDVSKNTALTIFSCSGNQLTALDVSKNMALRYLYCDGNQLTALDVSKNTALTELWCNDNKLSSLDISMLSSLDMGYGYFGNQKNSGTLTLTLTTVQNGAWTEKDDARNARITTIIKP